MTIVKHELKQGKNSFLIWTAAIAMLLAVCVFLFPEMKGEMDGISDVFASMGSFTAAFGMDRLNFGTLVGFYAIECGNVLGLGGAFYAALNLIIYAISVGSMVIIGEEIPWEEINLLHLAYYLLQIELAGICFGISAFLRKGSTGVGLGIAVMMYFMNLVANIAEVAEFLKYVTPFGYCEGADIVSNGYLDGTLIAIGLIFGTVGIVLPIGNTPEKIFIPHKETAAIFIPCRMEVAAVFLIYGFCCFCFSASLSLSVLFLVIE